MGNPETEGPAGLTVEASDVSGSKVSEISDIPIDYSVGEMVSSIIAEMQFPANDSAGNPLPYRAHLEREGRQLNPSEVVGDAIRQNDKLRIEPDNIDAG